MTNSFIEIAALVCAVVITPIILLGGIAINVYYKVVK
jgi:hypothetical protein